MTCEHGYIERQNADTDGMCVLCQQDEIERLRARVEWLIKNASPELVGKMVRELGVYEQSTREETTSEHIARDIREGRFPQKSKAQQIARINKYEPDDR